MTAPRTTVRGVIAVSLAIGLAVGACTSSSATPSPTAPGASDSGGDGGGPLSSGLASNLDKLDSYRFSLSNAGSPSGTGPSPSIGSSPSIGGSPSAGATPSIGSLPSVAASPSGSAAMPSDAGASPSGSAAMPSDAGASPSGSVSYLITGTVINRPSTSIWISETGAQFIAIGDKAWASVDGATWVASDPNDLSLTDLLPGSDYEAWFDAKASFFDTVGQESKNGVECVHYTGDESLGSLYSGLAEGTAHFQADVWIAVDGNYPVSGVYGFSDAAAGGGSWGFRFDVTHVDDQANRVTPPTNVVATPS
jgi:hypothetical protein